MERDGFRALSLLLEGIAVHPFILGPNSFPVPAQPEGRAQLRRGRGEESQGER